MDIKLINRHFTFPVIVIIASLTSCVSVIKYPKYHPPEITIDPSDVNRVLIVNRFDRKRLNFNQENKNLVFANGSRWLSCNLKEILEHDERFLVMDSVVNLPGICAFNSNTLLNKDTITALCERHAAQYIISLEFFNIEFSKTVDVVENTDGTKDRTASYDLVVHTGIAIYDSDGNTKYQAPIRQSKLYDQRSVISGLLAIGPSIGNAGNDVNELVSYINQEFMSRFEPVETWEVQHIYTGKPFNEAHDLMRNRDWENAIDALYPLTQHKKYKIRGKACYNLSVCYGFLQDKEQAVIWYFQAKNLLQDNLNFKIIELAIK